MSEYIERDVNCFDDCFHSHICIFRIKGDEFKKCPHFKNKADVVEVRHERWKKDWCDSNLLGHEYEVCTGCGCSMIDTNQFWDSPYCPNCGAKMDGKGEE